MPAAETNGNAADPEPEDTALIWDSGLAKFIGMLEADLLEWHSKERVKAKERQVKGARALEDVSEAEQKISEAPATKLVNISDSEPWQDRLEAVVNKATLQREEMRQMLELLRQHATAHLEAAGGPDFVERLPETGEGKPLGVESEEVTKLVSRFLEVADKVGEPAPPPSSRRRRGERPAATGGGGEDGGAAGKTSKDPIKEPRKAEKKPRQPRGGQRGRPPREQESGEYEYEDDSRSRTPRGRAALVPRRQQQRREPSFDSMYEEYSFSESRSPSFRGRGPGPRGPPRDDRRPPRGPRGREDVPRRGGRGPDRGGDRPGDVHADIDRFMRVNRLDGKVDKVLRELSPRTARRVMGLTGGNHTFELSGDIRDPTAVVMARVRKARDGPPPRDDRGGRGGGAGGGGGYGRDPQGPPRRGQRRPRSISSRSFSPRGDRGPRDHRRGPPPAGRGRRDDGYGDRRPNRGRREQEPSANEVPLGKEREFPQKSSANGA